MTYSTAIWIPSTKHQCVRWLSRFYGDKYSKGIYHSKKIKELQGWILSIRKRIGR